VLRLCLSTAPFSISLNRTTHSHPASILEDKVLDKHYPVSQRRSFPKGNYRHWLAVSPTARWSGVHTKVSTTAGKQLFEGVGTERLRLTRSDRGAKGNC
jgi:hypothetical protein